MSAVPTFEARYRGRCSDCREVIEPGQQVRYAGGGGGLEHEDCDASAPAPVREAAPCPSCWLTSCDCDAR